MEKAAANSISPGRLQARLGALLLLSVVGMVIALACMARNPTLAAWLARKDEAHARAAHIAFWNNGYFDDVEDRLINEELPAADYSRGGVFLLGASNARAATLLWTLPPASRALIHNYAIAMSNHEHKFQLVRHLVEHKGILRAGGEKCLFIFGVSYGEALFAYEPTEFPVQIWRRHNLFECTREGGIRQLPMHPITRLMRLERVRIAGCLQALNHTMRRDWRTRNGVPILNAERFAQFEERMRGIPADWAEKIAGQMEMFGAMIDYLTARQARVVIALLPDGTWENARPYAAAYTAAMENIAAEKKLPLYDWRDLLLDDEFSDSSHANVFGAEKVQAELLKIATPFLLSTGAFP
ncbi:MAG: hypothetical protein JNL39_19165 [Opitutaceae bacterium]|nr:hypothetical protein [Opitutaceae bacterium]